MRLALAVLLAGQVAAGCGTKDTVKPHGAEQVINRVVAQQTHFHPKDTKCPSGKEAKAGVTFECHFTGPEGPYTALMRVTRVNGTRVDFAVRTVPTP